MTFWSILRQRCWGLVLVVAGVCVITFIISHLIPGDPARLLAGDRASDAIVENIRQQLGLDQPLYVQFYRYVSDLFHGDLGTSIRTGRPVLEQLSEDYIRTARASGLPGWYIVLCYALPNALIPSITVLGLALGDLLYGAVLTETVFAWPGMGAWVVTSIQALDFPAVMGFAVVVSFAYVLVNLVVDLLYLWIDPRIGRGGGE
ncbi:ABC transporter permease [Escherichia coli]|nr:ABC transporter permease [Escherichia coli]ELB9230934.1 ABC transporter permease [Escherichia coli]ELB9256355.1 ABC transporter permease [Escherichia coli]